MRRTAIDFLSAHRLSLEGVLTTPDDRPPGSPAFVVCHPHPMLGGNMEHPLVTAICDQADRLGMGSLRFNFRGVGGSQGEFDNGEAEQADVKAALDILKLLPGVNRKRLGAVGYSFGASVILRGLGRLKGARSLALIAPPVTSVAGSRIVRDRRPKLFIAGQRDRVAPSIELQRALDGVRQPLQFAEVPADHSMSGREKDVAEWVAAFMAETL